MKYRKFGKTDLNVSEIGFGAWGIGGPSMAGDIPIGWGEVNDEKSEEALLKAYDLGVTFYDTADFYGLGHSEELLGKVLRVKKDVIIATKVGHRLKEDNSIYLDYSKEHILKACEESLKRLKRDTIDFYQLHSARMQHLENGECIEAMQQLKEEGKIRYWGLSLNTFYPGPEADYLMKNNLADGFQIVFNIINQKGLKVIKDAGDAKYGMIARMPLQFGLLTGKFNKNTRFDKNDHRVFRLTPQILSESLDALEEVWTFAEKLNVSKTALSLAFITAHPEISTVIPGIKTPEQAESNCDAVSVDLPVKFVESMHVLYDEKLFKLVELMERQG